MEDKLQAIEQRFEHLAAELADPAVLGDRARYETAAKSYAEIEPVVLAYRRRKALDAQLTSAREMLEEASGDAELTELARDEIETVRAELEQLDEELRGLLRPKDPDAEKSAILEIRSGTGGEEATLFAGELLRMYLRHAEEKGWRSSVIDESRSSVGGVKEAVISIEGSGAYSRLRNESGVHRVQRVPETEASGRIHTSAATVAVLPEVEDVEIDIDDSDLRIDTYTASGAGGQHVNRTLSAVRITHVPTGIVAQCQDEKSQHKNKAAAMKVLRARLHEQAAREQQESIAADRKNMVGSGDRSEKIRTYNFPQGRVTDHRVPVTIYKIHELLDGDLDPILDPVIAHFDAERLHADDAETP